MIEFAKTLFIVSTILGLACLMVSPIILMDNARAKRIMEDHKLLMENKIHYEKDAHGNLVLMDGPAVTPPIKK